MSRMWKGIVMGLVALLVLTAVLAVGFWKKATSGPAVASAAVGEGEEEGLEEGGMSVDPATEKEGKGTAAAKASSTLEQCLTALAQCQKPKAKKGGVAKRDAPAPPTPAPAPKPQLTIRTWVTTGDLEGRVTFYKP